MPDARVIPQLHVREAAELAYFGAKVLHPRALIPVSGRSIPVFVRPFADATAAGTEISARRTLDRYPVKALSAVGGQALLTVAGNGMLGVPGIAARTFEALHLQGISVSLISQSSSEQSICFSVPEGSARRARDRLTEEFRDQITRGEIDGIDSRSGLATVAVVGIGMAGHLGIAARVFAALAEAKINIVAIAQGSSELNISFVVAAKDVGAAQRAVHGAFQLSKIGGGAATRAAHTDAVLLGFGQIGRALAKIMAQGQERQERQANPSCAWWRPSIGGGSCSTPTGFRRGWWRRSPPPRKAGSRWRSSPVGAPRRLPTRWRPWPSMRSAIRSWSTSPPTRARRSSGRRWARGWTWCSPTSGPSRARAPRARRWRRWPRAPGGAS